MKLSENCYKLENTANPISPNVFCADPTGVEYNGRLYIYGTNDHQEYEAVGDDGKNGYAHIKSIVMLSTDDMVNWEYHGFIDVAKIAPWIVNSWAPSIASRVEADGKTHFYLYFSNSGCGVGVLTAEHPLGPWSDPLGKPLIYQNMPGLENCPAPFDPGVCIDENGTGWLAFGGGTPPDGNTLHTNVPKIVRLGKDMLSFDSDFVPIDAPYFFEASELNYENGTFIYTYSTDWQSRENWNRTDIPAPGTCSMGCMTSKTPLDPESWQFKGGFFLNAGDSEWTGATITPTLSNIREQSTFFTTHFTFRSARKQREDSAVCAWIYCLTRIRNSPSQRQHAKALRRLSRSTRIKLTAVRRCSPAQICGTNRYPPAKWL